VLPLAADLPREPPVRKGPIPLDPPGKGTNALMQALGLSHPGFDGDGSTPGLMESGV
jgi:hypothetical protein